MKSELRRRLLSIGLVLPLMTGVTAPVMACKMPETETARVEKSLPGAEIVLADGRLLLPAGIVLVEGKDKPLVSAGAELSLALTGERDRWNRWPALIGRVSASGETVWLDIELLSSGRAVRAAGAAALPCATLRRAAEDNARRDHRGVWAEGNWPIGTDDVDRLTTLTGQFVVVEGRLSSLGERPYITYLNFGRRWTQDTTITIRKPVWDRIASQLARPVRRGTLIRVRGMVQMRDGPLIEVTSPDQVELAEDRRGG